MKFRKKPVVIDAVQWTGDNRREIMLFFAKEGFINWHWSSIQEINSIFIDTLEGTHEARIGDWIIKGVNGEFYPCKPDIFEMIYEEVTDD